MGSSGLSQSSLHQSICPSFFTPSFSHSVFLLSSRRNANIKKRNRTAMACSRPENPESRGFCDRRAILFMGISVLPILHLRASAIQGQAADNSDMGTQEQKQLAEQKVGGYSPAPNPSFPFLNGIGVLSSGILGALYALTRREKAVVEATLESTKIKLNEKEAAIFLMKKNFESELLKEKEAHKKQLEKANEQQQYLTAQLKTENGTITRLGVEMQKEKRLAEELRIQIDGLETDIVKAGEDRKELEEKLKEKLKAIEILQERVNLICSGMKDKEDKIGSLSSILSEKELEFKKLSCTYEQNQDELARMGSEFKDLKDEFLKNEQSLNLKNALVDDLTAQVNSLLAERDDTKRKLDTVQIEYSDLKISSENKAALDSQLLGERENQLHQLKEQLKLALDEVSTDKALVADLAQEKDSLRQMLDMELKNVKDLERELQTTYDNLDRSRNESADLEKQLMQSQNLCSELETEVLKVRDELAEVKDSLQKNLDEVKQRAEELDAEVVSVKETLKKTEEELQMVSHELAASAENRDSLQKELIDVYKKAESAANDLKEEKKTVSLLNKELKTLETQLLKEKEARKSLETDLEESTGSLDEMNRNALTFSKDLEAANSTISSLSSEISVLHEALTEQKKFSQVARENLEDAHNLVMRLGKERESLEKRAKKLEGDLASAKGEILRLRSEKNESKGHVNDQDQQKGDSSDERKAAVSTKKTTRRKKVASQKNSS